LGRALALTLRFGLALAFAFALGFFRAFAPAFGFAGAAGRAGMGGAIGDAGGAGVGVQGSGSPNMRSIVSSVGGPVGSRLNYPAVEISPAQERN
jgi:hypothetical protein